MALTDKALVLLEPPVTPEDLFTPEQLAAIHAAGLDVFFVRLDGLL